MLDLLTSRRIFLLIAIATAVGMGFAFWLEYYLGLAPCPLCMTQRAFVILVGCPQVAKAFGNMMVAVNNGIITVVRR